MIKPKDKFESSAGIPSRLVCFFLALFMVHASYALDYADFFQNPEIQNLHLEAPFSKMKDVIKVLNILEVKSRRFDGTISYRSKEALTVSVPVTISIKGFTSISSCDFAKLELKFKNAKGTIFESIKRADLNTHCYEEPDAAITQDFALEKTFYKPHREAAAYKILEILGLKAFLAKPVFMSYLDSELKIKPEGASKKSHYQAFFVEDKSQFALQNHFTEIKGIYDVFKNFDLLAKKTTPEQYRFLNIQENQSQLIRHDLALMEVFESLILNGDWFVKLNPADLRLPKSPDYKVELWNVKVFEGPDKMWTVVPQDFNLSFLTTIERLPIQGFNTKMDRKIIDTLGSEERHGLAKLLLSKKESILATLALLKDDPQHDKLRDFLSSRIEFFAIELGK